MYVHVLFYRLDFISFCFIIVYTLYCFQNNMQLRLIKPRYLRGNENPSMEEQTIQWTKQKVKKSKQLSIRRVCIYQREVIRIRISKKNRQHNGQKKKYKRTNNDLQNIHIKLKIE